MTSIRKRPKRSCSVKELRRLFDYCPSTGAMYFTKDKYVLTMYNIEHLAGGTAYMNAGVSSETLGFRVSFPGFTALVHHIAWAWYYGEWPEYHIKHVNMDKTDNRIANLAAPAYLHPSPRPLTALKDVL